MQANEQVFADLPDAMVRDLLERAEPVATQICQYVEALRKVTHGLRQMAEDSGLVCRKRDLDLPPEPSVVGVDGSYQLHRLTALDLCAAAAIAVEGAVKEGRRHWPEPHYHIWAAGVPHQGQPVSVLRALMVSMEMDLAINAPHDVVLLDGSFASLVIYINQGASQMNRVGPQLREAFRKRWDEGLYDSLLDILKSRHIAAVPKFTSHNELCSRIGMNTSTRTDGKTLATLILQDGEYTSPIPLEQPPSPYHLPEPANNEQLNDAMRDIHVVYFRPYRWTAALRLELPKSVVNNPTRLATMLDGIERQFFTPAVFEPYPLFLADRMVKSLGSATGVLEQMVAQHVAGNAVDIETAMLFLQNYRTEGGGGGF